MTGKWSEGVQHRIDTSCRDDRGAFGDGGPVHLLVLFRVRVVGAVVPAILFGAVLARAAPDEGAGQFSPPLAFRRPGLDEPSARMRDVAGVFTEFQSPRRMRLPLGGRHVYAHYEELAVSLKAHFTAGKPARVVIVARDVPRPGRRHP
eukprot:tig00020805_g14007.t1